MTATRPFVFSVIFAAFLCSGTAKAQKLDLRPGHKIYHGVAVGTVKDADELEKKVDAYLQAITPDDRRQRKQLAWVYFDNEIDVAAKVKNGGFPTDICTSIYEKHGAVPYIRLLLKLEEGGESRSETNGKLELSNLMANGELRENVVEALQNWAEAANKTEKPILVEWGAECNAEWSPWYKKKADFKKLYGKIMKQLRIKAKVTRVFHINVPDESDAADDFEGYFPGTDHVDCVGVSVFGIPQKDLLVPFTDMLDPYYHRIRQKIKLPIIVSAFGCPKTDGPGALHWTQQALDALICDSGLRRVTGFSWWNSGLTYQGRATWKDEGKGVWSFQGKGKFTPAGRLTWKYLGDEFGLQLENNPLPASVFQRYLGARDVSHWPYWAR